MNFTDAIKTCFTKYVTFTGRAKRSEFWWFQLFYVILFVVAHSIHPILAFLAFIACFLPLVSVSVRRLHDIDHSGWFLLISFIPIIGALVLIYWFISEGTSGPNRFGN